MKFKKGDRVIVLGDTEGIKLEIPYPQKAVICGQFNRANILSFCEFYTIEFVIDDYSLISKLDRLGHRMPLRLQYSSRLLMRDNYCPICQSAVKVVGDKRVIVEHGIGTQLCYGSHSPLDLT